MTPARVVTALGPMPRNKLIEQRITIAQVAIVGLAPASATLSPRRLGGL